MILLGLGFVSVFLAGLVGAEEGPDLPASALFDKAMAIR